MVLNDSSFCDKVARYFSSNRGRLAVEVTGLLAAYFFGKFIRDSLRRSITQAYGPIFM